MINAIIMASGYSSRFGSNKLLLKYRDKTLIEHIVDKVLNCDFASRIIVAKDKEVLELTDKEGVKFVFNENAHLGQSESIKLGINNSPPADGYMFFTADQLLLDNETIELLMSSFNKNKDSITVPTYKGRRGSPVIFPQKYIEYLLKLQGDTGGRSIINKFIEDVNLVEVKAEYLLFDIDTLEDYEKIKDLYKF